MEVTGIFGMAAACKGLNRALNGIFIGTVLKCIEMLSKISCSSRATFWFNNMSMTFDSCDFFHVFLTL